MKKVTNQALARATVQVKNELNDCKLLTDDLESIEIRTCTSLIGPLIGGVFLNTKCALGAILGLEQGKIHIPRKILNKLQIRDLVRHEYGHGMLYHYPQILQAPGFSVFNNRSRDKDDYVSEYARINAEEDFCETLAVHLKHKGRFNAKTVAVARKLKFIRDLPRILRGAHSAAFSASS